MIRLVKCVCGPEHHTILAFAYEPGVSMVQDGGDEMALTPNNAKHWLRVMLTRMTGSGGGFHPYCGLCGSQEWVYLDLDTNYKTMREAAPNLADAVKAQRLTRMFFANVRQMFA